MTKHSQTRSTSRQWKLLVRCPVAKVAAVQEALRSQFCANVKLRKEGDDLKACTESFNMTFEAGPEEGGLAVFRVDAVLKHRTSVDRVSLPRLRIAVATSADVERGSLHIEDLKVRAPPKVAAAVPAEAPEPTLAAAMPAPAPAPEPAVVLPQLEVKQPPAQPLSPPAEIGIILPEPAPAPQAAKKKIKAAITRTTRANLAAAARPPPVTVVAAPAPAVIQPSPPPAPAAPATPSVRLYGRTVPPTAPVATVRVFAFGK